MSILNVWCKPDQALVVVDSETVDLTGSRSRVDKLYPISHMAALLAGRGNLGFLLALYLEVGLCASSRLGSFDGLLGQMPELLAKAFRDTRQFLMAAGIASTHFDQNEIVLVGWSREQTRMTGQSYRQQGPDGSFVAHNLGTSPGYIAPWHESLRDMPYPDSIETVEKLGRFQQAIIREHTPKAACGGRLIVATASQKGIAIDVKTGL